MTLAKPRRREGRLLDGFSLRLGVLARASLFSCGRTPDLSQRSGATGKPLKRPVSHSSAPQRLCERIGFRFCKGSDHAAKHIEKGCFGSCRRWANGPYTALNPDKATFSGSVRVRGKAPVRRCSHPLHQVPATQSTHAHRPARRDPRRDPPAVLRALGGGVLRRHTRALQANLSGALNEALSGLRAVRRAVTNPVTAKRGLHDTTDDCPPAR
jgi:hypothetical protein